MAAHDSLGIQFQGQKLYTDPKMQAAQVTARNTLNRWNEHPETDPLRGSTKAWNLHSH